MATPQSLSFGAMLRCYRIAAGLTQEALAARAGISARGVSDLERGVRRAPYQETIKRLAEVFQLSVSERAAFEAAAGRIRPLAVLPLAGRAGPAGATEGVRLHSRIASATIPPLAGRTAELAQMARHLAGEGAPLLLLSGEPGIGKSRLLRETADRALNAGWCVVEGGCQRRGGGEPYAPIVDALVGYIARQSPARLRADVQGCAWLVRLLPELVQAFVVPAPAWVLPADQERRLIFAAVRRLLGNVAGPAGTLLVLDDLQWAGADALDLLAVLARSQDQPPLRIVGAYRDTETTPHHPLGMLLADLAPAGAVRQLEVTPLDAPAAAALLAGLFTALGVADEGADLRAPLIRRAGGVPFFLVSCAQGISAQVADATGVAERAPSEPASGAVQRLPWDVAQSIRQRLILLPQAARDVVSAAATVGRVVSHVLLEAVMVMPEAELVAALEALHQARLLVEAGSDSYQFAHDLIREAVISDLSAARSKTLHRRIAQAMERMPGEPPVEALVYHYRQAGDQEKTIVYLERTAERAHATRAHVEEVSSYQELVDRLEALGRVAGLGAAYEKLAGALLSAACFDAALSVLDRAIELYRSRHDLEGLGRVLAYVGKAHAQRGTAQLGLDRLLPFVDELDARAISAQTLAALFIAQAHLFAFSGQFSAQLEAASRATDLARAAHDNYLLAQAELYRGEALGLLLRVQESLQVLEQVVPLAEAAGDLLTLSEALNNVAQTYENQGEFDKSMPFMERALEVAEQLGDPVQMALLTCNRGQSAFYMGAWDAAHDYHERAVALMSQLDKSLISAYPFGGLGLLLLSKGQREMGIAYLSELAASGERSADLGVLRYARCALAEYELLDGHPEHVVTTLTPLLDQAEDEETDVTKLLPLLAWAYIQLGDDITAAPFAEQSLTRATAQNLRRLQPDALRAKALVAMAQERWHDAEHALEEALALCQAMRYPYGEVKTLYVYGLLDMRRGDTQQARARLQGALTICARLGERLYATHIESALDDTVGSFEPP
jgi:tetratricopeptide (TPR) repeat protein/transcriptional regulator with XRE-family HTH domain